MKKSKNNAESHKQHLNSDLCPSSSIIRYFTFSILFIFLYVYLIPYIGSIKIYESYKCIQYSILDAIRECKEIFIVMLLRFLQSMYIFTIKIILITRV